VVLSVFNEEGCIRQTVMSVLSTLPRLAPSFVVIAVNDGSTDVTADMLSDLVRQHGARVQVVHHERNRGYRDALRSGFAAALACEADLVHVMDAAVSLTSENCGRSCLCSIATMRSLGSDSCAKIAGCVK
jgi:glycosyltransferase involved in cell wall biosynthesis